MIRVASMFAGIGGIDEGLRQAGGFETVWANDIDRHASKVFREHFPNAVFIEGDVKAIEGNSIPDHDLLVGGFPCQAFSVAGERKGLNDPRGTLFKEVARVAECKKPKMLLLENVKGLLSAGVNISTGIYKATKGEGKGELTDNIQTVKDQPERGWQEVTKSACKGFVFTEVLNSLLELGYNLEYQLVNSMWFGVPQTRERVIIIGYLGDKPQSQVFPITEVNGEINNANEQPIQETIIQIKRHHADGNHNIRTYENEVPTPTSQMGTGGGNVPLIIEPILTPNRVNKRQNGRRIKNHNDSMFTLTGQDIHGVVETVAIIPEELREMGNYLPRERVLSTKGISRALSTMPSQHPYYQIDNTRIRRLTPMECERLQGFPDEWTEGISESQRYKCLGNAVTVNMTKFIGERITKVYSTPPVVAGTHQAA